MCGTHMGGMYVCVWCVCGVLHVCVGWCVCRVLCVCGVMCVCGVCVSADVCLWVFGSGLLLHVEREGGEGGRDGEA